MDEKSASQTQEGEDADSSQASMISSTRAWKALAEHAEVIKRTTLEELLSSDLRNRALAASFNDIYLDFSHERVNLETLDLLFGKTSVHCIASFCMSNTDH